MVSTGTGDNRLQGVLRLVLQPGDEHVHLGGDEEEDKGWLHHPIPCGGLSADIWREVEWTGRGYLHTSIASSRIVRYLPFRRRPGQHTCRRSSVVNPPIWGSVTCMGYEQKACGSILPERVIVWSVRILGHRTSLQT